MELLLLWKAYEFDPTKGRDEDGNICTRYTLVSVVGLFSMKNGYAVANYVGQEVDDADYFDSDINCESFTYHTDLDSAISKYEECIAGDTSRLFGNIVRPIIVTDEDRKFISEKHDTVGVDKSCVLASYEYKDKNVTSFLLYVDSDLIIYDAHQIDENEVDSTFESGVSDFDCIEAAIDNVNEILSMTFDLDFDCFDKEEIMTRAKELKMI